MEKTYESNPWITKIALEIMPPSLGDNTADVDRFLKGLKRSPGIEEARIDFSLIRAIPGILRESHFQVDAILFEDRGVWHLIDILPGGGKNTIYGLAVDLGSSTVVVRLLNLSSPEIIDESSFHNPQIEIGADILMRIHFADREGGLDKLQSLMIDRLNEEINRLAIKNKIDIRLIVGMAVAGNTTMTHFFLGLDPHWICREPYIPVLNKPELIISGELGLAINSLGPVLVFPNVGSYFGGDLIAGILASGMTSRRETCFLVDVGTNAEVVIGNSDWLMACAGAAGPALEGGVADMGMMAGPGVIDKVIIEEETGNIKISTIGGDSPIGICGSGLIDLTAQLFLAGMIDVRGKFVAWKCGDRLIEMDGIRHMIVVPSKNSGRGQPLTISQTDIEGLKRSKAAMYAILTTISNTVGVPMDEISRFYVAGTFGAYIDPKSAITIGMIPDLPLETYVSLGNTSIEGANMALVSVQARKEIYCIRDRVTYLELNVNQEFMGLFSAAKFFPHTDRSLFPSVSQRKLSENGFVARTSKSFEGKRSKGTKGQRGKGTKGQS